MRRGSRPPSSPGGLTARSYFLRVFREDLRAVFFRELFLRELFLREVLARDVRFLAIRPLLAAFRFGAFLFLPAEALRDLPADFFLAFRDRFLGAGPAGGCGLGVKTGGGVG